MSTADPQPPPLPARDNGVGVAGFVAGVLGLVVAPTPLIGIFAWPLVIAGLVASTIGLRRALGDAPNKGLSIAGVACSAVGLVLCAATTYDHVAEPASAGAQQQSGPAGGFGDPVRDGMFEFTVTDMETGLDHVSNGFLRSEADGQYVIVHVTVRNTGDNSRTLSMSAQRLHDALGHTYTAGGRSAMMAMPEPQSFPSSVNPGEKVRAELLFDVPTGVELTTLELHDSAFSSGVTVSLE